MSFVGKYELVSSENFDEYLKAAGVGLVQRTAASKVKPVVEISEAGGKYSLKTLTALKNTEIVFTLGEEFDEKTADDRTCKSTVTKDGNKLIHVQKIGDETATITREFSGSEMKAIFSTKGVSSTRTYKKTG